MTDLILGTAQFGAAYGATNTVGRLPDSDVRSLLTVAAAAGIATLDTAADYGDAQERLGRLAPTGSRFVTKFSLPPRGEPVDADALFGRSCRTLGVTSLDGLLFHRLSDLQDARAPEAIDILRAARADGVVRRVGVSAYDEEDLRHSLEAFPDLDLVQIPASVADRRLLESELLARLRDRDVQIHVRSAFLQGLLLADPRDLPRHFAGLTPTLTTVRDVAAANGVPLIAVLLGYLRDHPSVDAVVVGAVRIAELAEILDAWRHPLPPIELKKRHVPARLLDPRSWPRD